MQQQRAEQQLPKQNNDKQLAEQNHGKQLAEPAIVGNFTAAPISINQRNGQYIVKFDIANIDKIDFNLHVNKCLQQNVFNALRKNTIHKPKKPRKLDIVANLTPEQLARKRASRREYYYNHREQFNAYVKQKNNTDPVYWEKKLNLAKDRYRRLRENVEKKDLE